MELMRVRYWCFFFFKQKTAYEMRISDWSSDVCSSDLATGAAIDLADRTTATHLCIAFATTPTRHARLIADISSIGSSAAGLTLRNHKSVSAPLRLSRPTNASAIERDRKSTRLNSSH